MKFPKQTFTKEAAKKTIEDANQRWLKEKKSRKAKTKHNFGFIKEWAVKKVDEL